MATQLQIRRGTTAQTNSFTGAEGELSVNTTTDTLHVHDGATAGGKALARADGSNIATYAGSFTTLTASGAATLNTFASSGATLTGGTINGVTVGATTPSTGAFTTIAASGAITGNVTGNLTGSILTAAQTNITSVGTLSTLAVSGTVTAGGLAVDGDGLLYSASNVEMRGNANVRISLGTAGTSGANNNSNWIYGNGTNLRFNNAGGFYSWETLGTESMRLSGGNLNVARTGYISASTNGFHANNGGWTHTSASSQPIAYFNRNTSDGDIAVFQFGGTAVGSIGVLSNRLYAGTGDTGFFFSNTTNAIHPWNTTSNSARDASIDLGASDRRFKDLHLSGTVALKTPDNASAAYMFVSPSTDFLYLEHPANGMIFRNTSGVERMRIEGSTGNVSIGNSIATSSFSAAANNLVVGSGSGSEGITIYGGAESNIFFADGTGVDAYVGRIEYSHGLSSMLFYGNNTYLMKLSTSGYFMPQLRSSSAANSDLRYNTSNGEIYYQTSSQRYKSNIVDLEFDTSNLYNLRPVSFDDNETGERCFGLIAEDTFEQMPEAVVTRSIDGETVPDSIPYSMLSIPIINEMKKLKAENDSLKARIEALEIN